MKAILKVKKLSKIDGKINSFPCYSIAFISKLRAKARFGNFSKMKKAIKKVGGEEKCWRVGVGGRTCSSRIEQIEDGIHISGIDRHGRDCPNYTCIRKHKPQHKLAWLGCGGEVKGIGQKGNGVPIAMRPTMW